VSWPIKLRAMSFAVTVGVTLIEAAMGAVPIGLVLWYFGAASTANIVKLMTALVATISLSISIYSHVRPTPFRRRTPTRGAA
jgi:hypothetical protein